jgi:iron donor protein CyaY
MQKSPKIDDNHFETVAHEWLESLFDLLEDEDDEARLDIDFDSGVLKIAIDVENILIVSKHSPSKQIWLSSPISGGLHFDAIDDGSDWGLKDGTRLSDLLVQELFELTGQTFTPNVL